MQKAPTDTEANTTFLMSSRGAGFTSPVQHMQKEHGEADDGQIYAKHAQTKNYSVESDCLEQKATIEAQH